MRLPAELRAFANARGGSGKLGRAFTLNFQWKAARETEAAFFISDAGEGSGLVLGRRPAL